MLRPSLLSFDEWTTKLVHAIALIVALVAGFLAWQQWDRQQALKKQIDSLTAEVANKDASVQEQLGLLDLLQEENEVFSREVASLRQKVTPSRPKSATGDDRGASHAPPEDGATQVFRRMSEDPRLKEVGNQWRFNRVKRIYGDFVKARQLNPLQTQQFFDLLAKEESRAREEEPTLYGSEENEAKAKETAEQFAMQKADIERQLKLLLGDNDYAAYEEYKTTASQRSTMLQIHEHLARNSMPLRADQADALLQIMLDEPTSTPPFPSDVAPNENGSNRQKFAAFVESDYLERYQDAQSERSQRILDRAKTILTPAQREELERFQNQQSEIERARIEAAREMIKRNKRSAPSPTVLPSSH